jgi:DNA-binding NtrC family response regulator
MDQTQHTLKLTDQSAVRLDACKLVQTTGEERIPDFELTAAEVIVGAAETCAVRLRGAGVSRQHFKIVRDGHEYRIVDLESTNGTFVDDARVRDAFLRPGSVIRAGDVHLRFVPIFQRDSLPPSDQTRFGDVLGQSYRMREIFGVLESVAATEATIVLCGETGTGKTALARAIHQASARAGGPFVVVDCAAIAPTLVESELFGHERGAFTGAIRQRAGAFEEANGGTVFIDELTDLSLQLQPKLLRALEEREITRVGNNRPIKVNCRVIAASQKDLWAEVEAGRCRSDLYFRLAVVSLALPALRERREDIPLLVDRFLAELSPGAKKTFADLEQGLQRTLLAHEWPGNLRELRNTIERVALMHGVDPFARPGKSAPTTAAPASGGANAFSANLDLPFKEAKEELLVQFERSYVTRLLERVGGSVTEAARVAGLDRKHIYNLMTKHGLGS